MVTMVRKPAYDRIRKIQKYSEYVKDELKPKIGKYKRRKSSSYQGIIDSRLPVSGSEEYRE